MMSLNEHFVVDADGKRIAVLLDIETYERLRDALEELEDIQDAEEALAALESGEEEAIPIEQAIAEYEQKDFRTLAIENLTESFPKTNSGEQPG